MLWFSVFSLSTLVDRSLVSNTTNGTVSSIPTPSSSQSNLTNGPISSLLTASTQTTYYTAIPTPKGYSPSDFCPFTAAALAFCEVLYTLPVVLYVGNTTVVNPAVDTSPTYGFNFSLNWTGSQDCTHIDFSTNPGIHNCTETLLRTNCGRTC